MYPNGALVASSPPALPGGVSYEALGPWVTVALSCCVIVGYCVIAVDWYFQSKLARHVEARATLRRLLGIIVACCLAGLALYWVDIPWIAWRAYDALLVIVALRTWAFVLRTRGLSLVDERLALIDELEASAAKYRQIAELLPHMVWTATADGRIDFSNQRWREYASDDRTWLDTVHPDEAAHVQGEWSEALASRTPVTLEARLGGAAGYRTFVVRATPIVHRDAVKWLGACADVEDQKRLAVEKETQARQKTFFLNALSHDLRAPLHNVLLNAHLLKLEMRDGQASESVETIMENAVEAGELLTRLLDFARVGATEAEAIEDVPVMAVINQIVRRFLPVAEQKGLSLRV